MVSQQIESEAITVEEAAKISHYHPEYIRYLIRVGKIEAQKIGRMWFVSGDSLVEYARKHWRAIDEQN